MSIIHGFAALNKAVEEGGNLCTGLSDVEQSVLLAKTEWSDCILRSLVATCSERIIEEPGEGFPPVQRILESNLELPNGLVHILETEDSDLLKNRSKYFVSAGDVILLRDLSSAEGFSEMSFFVEEISKPGKN